MKTGSGGGRDDLKRYYEYYDRQELEGLLRTANLSPKRHWTGYGKGLSGQYSGWIVMHANA